MKYIDRGEHFRAQFGEDVSIMNASLTQCSIAGDVSLEGGANILDCNVGGDIIIHGSYNNVRRNFINGQLVSHTRSQDKFNTIIGNRVIKADDLQKLEKIVLEVLNGKESDQAPRA